MTNSGNRKAPEGVSDISGLQALVSRSATAERGLPPVDSWNPDHCGDIDIVIRGDGSWHYLGSPIGRAPLVRLFSTVLRKDDDGRTYLVTPAEKLAITVEDAHFVAVEMHVGDPGPDQVLTFRTNVGDVVEAGREHPLRFETDGKNDGLKPYLHVRGRLEARLGRAVTYELAGLGETVEIDGKEMFAVRSGGECFAMMPAEELERAAS